MRGQPLRVLLVDDEASLREPLAKYLRRECGYYVDTAANGEEALARIEGAQGQYDVALVDNLLMPGPDLEPEPLGIKLMAEIKALYPHIEFILFTAWGMDSGLEALRAGAYRYVRKPFNVEELAVMIEHAAEYQRLKGVAQEKQILEQLIETSTALLGGGGLQDVLDTILREVQAIGFDRVRLYLLSEDGQTMVGEAQVGMEAEFVGLELPVADDVYVQALLADPRPHVFERKGDKPLPYEQQLAKEEVNQWACVPLLLQEAVIGKLSADNKFSQRPILEAELGPVALFASQAAAAIENARLRDREQEATQKAKQRARNLTAIQEVSTAISSLHELNKILDATCRAAVELFGVNHSGLVLFEPDYERGLVVAEYPDLGTRDIEIPLRGIPAEEQLTTSKEPLVISNVAGEPSLGSVRDILDEFDICSILIAPVVFKGRVLGSFSLDVIGRSHTFTEDELELCKTFAAQVAVAIENAKLYENLEKQTERLRDLAVGLTALYEIGVEMTSDLELGRILDSIAEHIVRVVGARESLFLLVDKARGRLIKAAGHGYPPEHLQRLTFEDVEAGVSGWVLRTGKPALITDAQSDPRNTGIALESAKRFDTAPLIVAPLMVEGEIVGTLTAANTADDPPFTEEDLNLVVMLAHQAALALRNAKLLDQVNKARNAARVVAEVTVLEDLRSTLDSIVAGTRDALGCDVVTLYTYDQGQEKFGFPPAMAGVRHREKVLELGRVAERSVIHNVLVLDDLHVAADTMADSLMRGPFVEREGIASSVGIPLIAKQRKVGVMFVNYRRQHRFTTDELINIRLFANQAAVAIRNAQLYQQVQKRAGTLQALNRAGRVVTGSLNLDEILSAIAEQAWELTGTSRSSHLGLKDGNKLILIAAYPPEHLPALQKIVGDIDLEQDEPIGVMGRAVKTGQSQLLGNVSLHPDYIAYDPETHSELAVPIKVGEEVIGVVDVEHSSYHAFDEEDQQALESLAAQAAIAIQNASLYQEKERSARQMAAIAEISRVINTSLDLDIALNTILTSIEPLIGYTAAEICLWDEEEQAMLVVGTAGDARYTTQANGFYALHEGYTGWIARRRKPLLIEDSLECNDVQPKVIDQNRPIRSFLGVPLQVGYDRFGTLELVSDSPQAFDKRDEQLLNVIGQHAITAIKNAWLFETEQCRAEHLAAIHQVSMAAGSTLDSSEIFRKALVEMLKVFKLDQGRVTLYDYEGGYGITVIESSTHPQLKGPNVPIPLDDNPAVKWILTHKQPLAIEDASYDARLDRIRKVVNNWQVKSMLLVPLVVKGRVIGTFGLDAIRARRKFTNREIELAQTMVNQLATAVENAQLYEQVEKRVMVLKALYEASRVVISSLELDEILNSIVRQAWNLTISRGKKISFASIRLVEEMKIRLVTTYPHEELKVRVASGKEIDLNEGSIQIGIVGRAIKTGAPQLVGDVTYDPDYLEVHSETRSELAVPIKIGDEVIGAINVEHPDYNAFDREDQYALESLAAQAAIAIQNARLFKETQRHVRLLNAAAKVARGAASILDQDQLLDEAVHLVVNCFDFLYHAGVFLLDGEYAVLRAASSEGGQRMLERGHKLKVGQEGLVGFVTQTGRPRLALDIEKDPYHLVNPDLPLTRSEMVFPLIARGQVTGALDVQSTKPVNLRDEDIATLQTMADQLANAIHNAHLYQQVTERLEEANALQQVAASLTGASELHEVLDLVMTEAVKLTNTEGGSILLWDAQAEEFTKTLRTDSEGRLRPYPSRVRTKEGLTRMIIEKQQPIAISDTLQEPRINPGVIAQGYRASLGVPLVSQAKSIGVLYVRSKRPHQFSERQVVLLKTLASQAAVAIDRARQYEELKRTKGLVGTRTAVAWMGMVSSAWRHAIEGHAITIREEIQQLRSDLPQQTLVKVDRRLTKVERLTEMILDKPITPPLSEEEGVESISINELVQERVRQLWENEPYQSVGRQLDLALNAAATVRASPEWLRRVFDVLVDNAIEAMTDVPDPALTVSTRAAGTNVEVVFADTGQGIPENILPKLFHEQIKKPKGAEGLGMGLLMAQTIAQTYGGEIRVESTSSAGTSMAVSLPIETQSVVG